MSATGPAVQPGDRVMVAQSRDDNTFGCAVVLDVVDCDLRTGVRDVKVRYPSLHIDRVVKSTRLTVRS